MALIACPKCATPVHAQAEACPNCGAPIKFKLPPIRRLSGKFKAIGAILVAVSIIAMVNGAWWGAALLFPGVVIFFMGRLM